MVTDDQRVKWERKVQRARDDAESIKGALNDARNDEATASRNASGWQEEAETLKQMLNDEKKKTQDLERLLKVAQDREARVKATQTSVPSVTIEQCNSGDGFDTRGIRSRLRTNTNKFLSCYERQLPANPALAGTVEATFLITPNGLVQSSTASGVNGPVSSCVAAAIKDIEFRAQNKGTASVNCPFHFNLVKGVLRASKPE
jgi:hypothetical protein